MSVTSVATISARELRAAARNSSKRGKETGGKSQVVEATSGVFQGNGQVLGREQRSQTSKTPPLSERSLSTASANDTDSEALALASADTVDQAKAKKTDEEVPKAPAARSSRKRDRDSDPIAPAAQRVRTETTDSSMWALVGKVAVVFLIATLLFAPIVVPPLARMALCPRDTGSDALQSLNQQLHTAHTALDTCVEHNRAFAAGNQQIQEAYCAPETRELVIGQLTKRCKSQIHL